MNPGTAVVTVTGKGNYTGTVLLSFTIQPSVQSIARATVTLSRDSYAYTGTARRPAVTVVLNGATLRRGTDYTVMYQNNIDRGTAYVVITGTGNYTGTLTRSFLIQ